MLRRFGFHLAPKRNKKAAAALETLKRKRKSGTASKTPQQSSAQKTPTVAVSTMHARSTKQRPSTFEAAADAMNRLSSSSVDQPKAARSKSLSHNAGKTLVQKRYPLGIIIDGPMRTAGDTVLKEVFELLSSTPPSIQEELDRVDQQQRQSSKAAEKQLRPNSKRVKRNLVGVCLRTVHQRGTGPDPEAVVDLARRHATYLEQAGIPVLPTRDQLHPEVWPELSSRVHRASLSEAATLKSTKDKSARVGDGDADASAAAVVNESLPSHGFRSLRHQDNLMFLLNEFRSQCDKVVIITNSRATHTTLSTSRVPALIFWRGGSGGFVRVKREHPDTELVADIAIATKVYDAPSRRTLSALCHAAGGLSGLLRRVSLIGNSTSGASNDTEANEDASDDTVRTREALTAALQTIPLQREGGGGERTGKSGEALAATVHAKFYTAQRLLEGIAEVNGNPQLLKKVIKHAALRQPQPKIAVKALMDINVDCEKLVKGWAQHRVALPHIEDTRRPVRDALEAARAVLHSANALNVNGTDRVVDLATQSPPVEMRPVVPVGQRKDKKQQEDLRDGAVAIVDLTPFVHAVADTLAHLQEKPQLRDEHSSSIADEDHHGQHHQNHAREIITKANHEAIDPVLEDLRKLISPHTSNDHEMAVSTAFFVYDGSILTNEAHSAALNRILRHRGLGTNAGPAHQPRLFPPPSSVAHPERLKASASAHYLLGALENPSSSPAATTAQKKRVVVLGDFKWLRGMRSSLSTSHFWSSTVRSLANADVDGATGGLPTPVLKAITIDQTLPTTDRTEDVESEAVPGLRVVAKDLDALIKEGADLGNTQWKTQAASELIPDLTHHVVSALRGTENSLLAGVEAAIGGITQAPLLATSAKDNLQWRQLPWYPASCRFRPHMEFVYVSQKSARGQTGIAVVCSTAANHYGQRHAGEPPRGPQKGVASFRHPLNTTCVSESWSSMREAELAAATLATRLALKEVDMFRGDTVRLVGRFDHVAKAMKSTQQQQDGEDVDGGETVMHAEEATELQENVASLRAQGVRVLFRTRPIRSPAIVAAVTHLREEFSKMEAQSRAADSKATAIVTAADKVGAADSATSSTTAAATLLAPPVYLTTPGVSHSLSATAEGEQLGTSAASVLQQQRQTETAESEATRALRAKLYGEDTDGHSPPPGVVSWSDGGSSGSNYGHEYDAEEDGGASSPNSSSFLDYVMESHGVSH